MNNSFKLELHSPSGEIKNFRLDQKLVIGTADDTDIKFNDPKLLDYHCAIKKKAGIIAIHNLAGDGETKVNQYSLAKGKMYLLAAGDRIHLGDHSLVVVKEYSNEDKINDETSPSTVITEKLTTETDEVILDDIEIEDDDIEIEDDDIEIEDDDIEIEDDDIEIEDDDIEIEDDDIEIEDDDIEIEDDDLSSQSLDELAVKIDFPQEAEEEDEENEEDEEEKDEEEDYDEDDLKMLEAIQEGRQPESNQEEEEEETKPSLLKRAFSPKKINVNKKEIFQRMPYPAPKFSIRFLAFIANIAISYSIVFTLFPIFNIGEYLKDELKAILELLSPFFTTLNIDPIVYLILTFIFLDILSNFILGASLPYFLMGVKSNDRELSRRIKGVMRSIIGIITLPLIIFDLPALVGNATFKEVVTRSRLGTQGNSFARLFATFFIVIPLIGICLISPFILDPENIAGIDVLDTIKRKRNKMPNTKAIKGTIKSLSLSIDTELSPELQLLPYFNYSNKKIKSSLILLSNKKKKQAFLSKVSSKINYKELILNVYRLDPLFPMIYPTLTNWAIPNKAEKAKLSKKQFMLEFEDLIRQSFTLRPPSYFDFVLKNGPFPSGYIILREKILEALRIYTPYSATFAQSRKSKFITLQPNQLEQQNSNYYFTFEQIPPEIFEVNFSQKSNMIAKIMERDILYSSKIGEITNQEITSPYNTFELMDIINDKTRLLSADPTVFKQVKEFYLSRFRRANPVNDKYIKKYLLKSANSLIKSLKSKYKGKKYNKIKPLIESLSSFTKKAADQERTKGVP